MALTWPPSLPQVPQKGYTEEVGAIIVKTPMDAGPAKIRRRSNKPAVLNLTFIMTTADLTTLDTFIQTTLGYVSRFAFPHPRTGSSVDCRIMPTGEGTMYNISYLAPGYYTISMQFEVMP
jgi:hypothetical protein